MSLGNRVVSPAALSLIGVLLSPVSAASEQIIDLGETNVDPNTGLTWLDLSMTANMSYLDILNGQGGFLESGWRYATADEVVSLWANMGITYKESSDPDYGDSGSQESFLKFFDVFGLLCSDLPSNIQSQGLIDPEDYFADFALAAAISLHQQQANGDYLYSYADVSNLLIPPYIGDSCLGSYLVLDKIAPLISVVGGISQECNELFGATVEVSASVPRLPDDDSIVSTEWFIDAAPAAFGNQAELFISLGSHVIGVRQVTQNGLLLEGSTSVEVRDTIAPVIRNVVLDPDGKPFSTPLRPGMQSIVAAYSAADVCDPQPVVEAVAGVPISADEAIKINASIGAIIINGTFVRISVTAVDASGNASISEISMPVSE